jgi:hypothetical protein
VVGSTILGSADFVKEIKARFIDGKKANRDLPAIRALSSKPDIENIINAVESAFIAACSCSECVTISMSQTHGQ